MNGNINEKKGKRKICGVLLVVALLGSVTMLPSVMVQIIMQKNIKLLRIIYFLEEFEE